MNPLKASVKALPLYQTCLKVVILLGVLRHVIEERRHHLSQIPALQCHLPSQLPSNFCREYPDVCHIGYWPLSIVVESKRGRETIAVDKQIQNLNRETSTKAL